MGKIDAGISPEPQGWSEPASMDELMPRALATLVASISVPEAARRRAMDVAEAMLMRELAEAAPPPPGRSKTPSHPCTVPPDSA